MKHLIRKFSKIADSSEYFLLKPDSFNSSDRRLDTNGCKNRKSHRKKGSDRRSGEVPVGHLPLYVGEEMERFVVSAKFLNHPIFLELLSRSAQEYGYEQKGVLRIPCSVIVFRRILVILYEGIAGDVEGLVRLCSMELL